MAEPMGDTERTGVTVFETLNVIVVLCEPVWEL